MQSGKATAQELYLWALKIRYGLSLKDTALPLDRKQPERGPLLSRAAAAYGEDFIRHAFLALDKKPFMFRPYPFGSVFVFTHHPSEPETFDFVDVPPPYWSLAIKLPSHKTLAVLFADRGVTKRIMRQYAPLKNNIEQLALRLPGAKASIIMFELLRWQIRLVIPSGYRSTDKGVISARIPRKIPVRTPKLDWYRQIAANCGLPDELAHKAFDRDKDALGILYLRLA